jgi:4'-phosphopantetheinyl transferase
MVYVYYCKNNLLSEDVYRSWLRLMPPGFVQKLNKLVHRHDAQASLLGRILLLYALKQLGYGYLTLGDIRFNIYQRPYFDNTDIDFNISHSGDYVLCAVGRKNRVGIDIEEVRPIILEDFVSILSAEDLQEICRHPNGKLECFYNIWTRKEALVKAEGSGLNFPVQEICIIDGKAMLSGSVWYLYELPLLDGYKVHLAFQAPAEEKMAVSVKPLNTMEMIDFFF